jgi:hypothetical protein
MANIKLKIDIQVINFKSENFDTQVDHFKSFEYSLSPFTEQDMHDLIYKVTSKKGDWYSYNYTFSRDCVDVCITLVFTNELSDDEKIFLESMEKECLAFFQQRNAVTKLEYRDRNSLTSEEGLFIEISNHEADIFLDHIEMENILKENNIEYDLVSFSGSQSQCGCGSGTENFLIFLKGSIESGIAWDLIKPIIYCKIGDFKDYIKIHYFDNAQFKKIRKIIADRIHEEENDIDLRNFVRDSENNRIHVTFSCKKKKITVICNDDYRIDKIKVS